MDALWIGLHLPQLAIELFEATLPPASPDAAPLPLAVMAAHRVVSANAEAMALGVQPGQKRATALALAPRLAMRQADVQQEARALVSVAHAALAFTPMVCLSPPQGVLLEVNASLRCFGGHDALCDRLRAILRPLGHRIACASAPTAQGAHLLSQWQDGLHCRDVPDLHQALAQVPTGLLASAQAHEQALQGMGLRTVGALLRLPRSGVARRFGEDLLDELDRTCGRRPDPRVALVALPVFDSGVELFARADAAAQVRHGAQVLLQRLVAWLSAKQAFVRRFTLQMKHEPRWRRERQIPDMTCLEVALAQPSRDADHLQSLLDERLSRLRLPAPTLELGLQARDIVQQPPPNADLFPAPRNEREGLTRLIERLQARLGSAKVQRWRKMPDHRPEKSLRREEAEPGECRGTNGHPASDVAGLGLPRSRPAWLWHEAQALPERRAQPVLDGQALQLVSGPERIESGWWDSGVAERDYFIAQTPQGALVWIYRNRLPWEAQSPGGWFLQGRFG